MYLVDIGFLNYFNYNYYLYKDLSLVLIYKFFGGTILYEPIYTKLLLYV